MNQAPAIKDLSPEVKRIWLTRHEEPEPCEPFMVSESRGVELDRLERIDQAEKILQRAKDWLSKRELDCLFRRAVLEETYKEIGMRHGVRGDRAKQLFDRACRKLRSPRFVLNHKQKQKPFPKLSFGSQRIERPKPIRMGKWLPQELPQDAHIHPNGLGWVANTASVSASAYVGPSAKVLGFAEVRDYAVIADHAIIKDHATVSGDAVVGGYSTIRDHAQVHGERQKDGSLICTFQNGPFCQVFQGGIFQ